MGQQRTDKSKYPSKYSPNKWVTGSQYIVELVCERKARKDKKDLPTQFWKLKEWATFYRSQVNTANSLVKKYGVEAVIAALKNKNNYWMYSLRAPGFEDIVKQEKRVLVKRAAEHRKTMAEFTDNFEDNLVQYEYKQGFSPNKLTDTLEGL